MTSGVYVVGAFPPPVHGMSKNTLAMANCLDRSVAVVRVDISADSLRKSFEYHIRRLFRVASGLWRMLADRKRGRVLYIASDGGLGLIYTVCFVLVARLMRKEVFIHHRSFSYIDRKSLLATVLVWIAGYRSRHIFLCFCMEREFRTRYKQAVQTRVVSNAHHTPLNVVPKRSLAEDGPLLTLGHLSNLSVEKGLVEVLSVIRGLVQEGRRVRLLLAGPAATVEADRLIRSAMSELQTSITYLGAVHGVDKTQFFSSIDVFLFPTKYVNEAQPNVIFEALSFGVPVIACSKGCIAEDLGQGGIVVSERDYVDRAKRYIVDSLVSEELFSRRRAAAYSVARRAHRIGCVQFNDLLTEILSEADKSVTGEIE